MSKWLILIVPVLGGHFVPFEAFCSARGQFWSVSANLRRNGMKMTTMNCVARPSERSARIPIFMISTEMNDMGLPRTWHSSYVRCMHPMWCPVWKFKFWGVTSYWVICLWILSWSGGCMTIWYNSSVEVSMLEILACPTLGLSDQQPRLLVTGPSCTEQWIQGIYSCPDIHYLWFLFLTKEQKRKRDFSKFAR